MILTACNLKNTDLLVKRIEAQVHWASQGQRYSKQIYDFDDDDVGVKCDDNHVESLKASLFKWSGEVNGRVEREFYKNAPTLHNT